MCLRHCHVISCAVPQLGELFGETKEELREKLEELEATSTLLAETKAALQDTRVKLTHTRRDRDEQRHLVDTHVNTERKLHDQAAQASDHIGRVLLI